MILVTGATGTVGSGVVKQLTDQRVPVRAFVRNEEKARALLGESVELAQGDFSDADSLRRALDAVDAVFLACTPEPRQAELEQNVIDAVAATEGARVVYLSARPAEVGSSCAFWDSNGKSERSLRESGLPATVLRPTWFMSQVLPLADQVRSMRKFFVPAEGARIAMIDPGDVASVAIVALTRDGHEGETYELTGPEAITYGDVATELSEVTGRTVEFVPVSDDASRDGLVSAGLPQWVADHLVRAFGRLRQGVAEETTNTVRTLTGRDPRTLGEFVRDHADVFTNTG